jgi:hypothetical protein
MQPVPRSRCLLAAFAFLPVLPPNAACASIWVVYPDGSGDTSTIAAALAGASAGDEIVLAPGTFVEHDIELVDGVRLHGITGFAADVVIDAAGLGRVMRAIGAGPGTSIEHLTVRGGLVQGTCGGDPGTGTYCMGGAVLLIESAPSFIACDFLANEAQDNGGAVASVLSAPTFSDCRFEGNRARHGGAITFVSSSLAGALPRIDGSVFESNVAGADGGAIYAYLSDPILTHSTFRANESGEQGSGMFWYEPTPPVVEQCIFAFGLGGEAMFSGFVGAAPSLSCCDVAGNAGGDWVGCLEGQDRLAGNLSSDPLFCDAAGAEVRGDSPCATSSCGLIGAAGGVCAATHAGPVAEVRSWGLVKSAYRSDPAR